jgi:hypothetical protein
VDKHCQAELISGKDVRRVLRLTGRVEATVHYDGQGTGYEAVYVDDALAATVPNMTLSPWPYRLMPRIDFILRTQTGEAIPARIDVQAKGWRKLGGFRLCIGDEVVYAEGFYETLISPDLPITTEGAQAAVETLPIPANEDPS